MPKNGTPAAKATPQVLYIRDMPTDVLRRLRACAALQGKSTKQTVVEALEDYLKKKGV